MPTRRSALLGLGALIAGGGAVLGTGAFTSVQAERTMNVETAGDENAFLQLEPAVDGSGNQYPNADAFADGTGDTLEITIGGQGSNDSGVNLNAITHIDRVFQVSNNGTQPVVLYIQELPGSGNPDGNAIDIGARLDQGIVKPSGDDLDSVSGSSQPSGDGIDDENIIDISRPSPPDSSGDYSDTGVLLDVGQTLVAGVYIDTSDRNLNDGLNESTGDDFGVDELLLEQLVIYADATAAEDSNYYVKLSGGNNGN